MRNCNQYKVFTFCIFLIFFTLHIAYGAPKNVILLIGDGMGPEEIKAAGMYENGTEGTLSFESFPYQAQMTTFSANSSVTDSAASATAMATGTKVNNGVISTAIPGDSSELATVLENLKTQGKSTYMFLFLCSHASGAF